MSTSQKNWATKAFSICKISKSTLIKVFYRLLIRKLNRVGLSLNRSCIIFMESPKTMMSIAVLLFSSLVLLKPINGGLKNLTSSCPILAVSLVPFLSVSWLLTRTMRIPMKLTSHRLSSGQKIQCSRTTSKGITFSAFFSKISLISSKILALTPNGSPTLSITTAKRKWKNNSISCIFSKESSFSKLLSLLFLTPIN